MISNTNFTHRFNPTTRNLPDVFFQNLYLDLSYGTMGKLEPTPSFPHLPSSKRCERVKFRNNENLVLRESASCGMFEQQTTKHKHRKTAISEVPYI